MLLAIDVGNTQTVFAIFSGDKVVGSWRLSTDAKRTADEYALALTQLMEISDLDDEVIVKNAIISSVVPQATGAIVQFCSWFCDNPPLVIGDKSVNLGIKIRVDNPHEVGADRLVNAVAALDRFGGDVLIIDFGTATTFDLVSKKAEYLGGVIAPGVQLSLNALHAAAAKLPKVEVARPEKIIGTSTVEAMQSGVFWGYIGLVEGIASRIVQAYGAPLKVIATGGLSGLFTQGTNIIEQVDMDLTMHGLKLVYDLNRKKRNKQK
jgi:type III pantothenate kinase